ncbi:divisome protein SepX/GlpR [Streptomyces iconiensis]|uniref:Uncharacterized protein n=1 Tax=Streptomyces iconiensis TaxID=1384038 RepID=A0ABT7A520_9ACTN|nr:gephyrin-like molybdotransferase receptor GlpR [Streptomyces iconiensis]MDJ1136435.1 hypothetical protein [Streptomyces iconiensis]
MSSSGLIYAVIVGAWAAYLVPMWLRRQDELNEARPTERFSTAIRLLSGKAGMERRYARDAERREARDAREADDPPSLPARAGPEGEPGGYGDDAYRSDPDAGAAVDVRAFADPKTMVSSHGSEAPTEALAPAAEGPRGRSRTVESPDGHGHEGLQGRKSRPGTGGPAGAPGAGGNAVLEAKRAKQVKRAKLLARRRRTTMMLFLAFSVGAVVAAVGGLAFLWAPAAPAALLSAYIAHLRGQERRRFTFTMDRQRAEAAARNLHERRPRPGAARDTRTGRVHAPAPDAAPDPGPPSRPGRSRGRTREPRAGREPARGGGTEARTGGPHEREPRGELRPDARQEARARAEEARARAEEQEAAERRALVEQTDHAEWVDQQRAPDREHPEGEGWEPVPVPLPTYVSAPVAPRTNRNVDLEAPDAWSSARSSSAPVTQPAPAAPEPAPEDQPAARPRRTRDRSRTPLFDQYEDEDRPRAANE